MRKQLRARVVVPVSGGKDSQACLKLALEHHEPWEVRGVMCDTGWEHPLTWEHVERMRAMYGVQIDVVRTPRRSHDVPRQVLKHSRFPGGGSRFCTEELKIWPAKWYYTALAKKQGGFEVWPGMRSGESPQRLKRYAGKVGDDVYEPNDVLRKYPKYLGKMGVRFRLAILEWSREDVINYVGAENLNPLYAQGFDRVGCFPCLASGDAWKEKAFNHDDFGQKQYQRVLWLAEETGASPWDRDRRAKKNPQTEQGSACALHCQT